MASIFSTQNLQTFLRRKYLRPPPPPSRPPPGPPGREDGRRSPRSGRSLLEDDSDDLVSSAMMLLKISRWSLPSAAGFPLRCNQRPRANDRRRFLCCCRRSFSTGLRRRRWRSGLPLSVFDRLDLVQTLLLFIDTHGEELDHWLGDAQTALQLVNQTTAAFDGEQHVNAVVELPHRVGQPPLAHSFHALYLPRRGRDRRLQRGNKLVLILFRHIGTDDEHQFISTIHSIVSLCRTNLRNQHESFFTRPVFIRANLWLIFFPLNLAIEAVHRCRRAVGQNHLYRIGCDVEHFIYNFELRLAQRRQQITHSILDLVIRRNPHPDSQKILCPQTA